MITTVMVVVMITALFGVLTFMDRAKAIAPTVARAEIPVKHRKTTNRAGQSTITEV